jgi:outer membrane biosynthesis protein TonB
MCMTRKGSILQGHHDISNNSQQDARGRFTRICRIAALALLGTVLSGMFGSASPRQVFAASTACASAAYTVASGDTTQSAGQQMSAPPLTSSTTKQSSLTDAEQQNCASSSDQYRLSKVPLHPTLTSTDEVSKVATQPEKNPAVAEPAPPMPTPTPEPVATEPPVESTPEPVVTEPPVQQPVETPSPTTGSTSVEGIIDEVFGQYAAGAKQIAICESGLNPNAFNSTSIGGSNAAGLFQILYPSTWNTTSQAGASPYDARANATAAYEIFVRDGYSWREWSCQP